MELGFGDQDLIYEEEAKRLAESAPVPRPMCLSCSKLVAESPMLQCPLAYPPKKCVQCAKFNLPCHIVPPQFRGDLERIQALAREFHVRPSPKTAEQLQGSSPKYIARAEAYELKESALEGYTPYQVPRPLPPPVPINPPVKTVTPMNSLAPTEDALALKIRNVQQINDMLSKMTELLFRKMDLP
ncbi:hypothetical protein MGYG_00644 [Nannizzia gypsea CBS 118893]|uniref:Uncharacterized protein n=1 Tax=Arthroderma gypseum (strain ATCC MYA-4604 / CBS 118893) TaxID=535722 RepID=E5R101_ARTGP|nr:hypothetical protein MGYG_00644 [Nannizzia gypsea CBS 118893]EFQ97605.1 hypothetical protein MGYG_00644 [Nannizzia gypsea CBS 118893]